MVSDHTKKIGTSDAFYVTIRHVFDYTFLNKNIRECSLQIYSIAQWIGLWPVNSNTTGTITPMFSSYDWMKPNLKQKAGTARGKWLVRKDWGKLRGVKSLFLSENMLEK